MQASNWGGGGLASPFKTKNKVKTLGKGATTNETFLFFFFFIPTLLK